MKIRIHSPKFVQILFILALVMLLAMGGISPARALQPASHVYAAESQTGID